MSSLREQALLASPLPWSWRRAGFVCAWSKKAARWVKRRGQQRACWPPLDPDLDKSDWSNSLH